MDYIEFCKNYPILYGVVHFKEGSKIGAYICEQSPYSGVYVYRYYSQTKRGLRRGMFAIEKKRAFELFNNRQLSEDKENGNKENYL